MTNTPVKHCWVARGGRNMKGLNEEVLVYCTGTATNCTTR